MSAYIVLNLTMFHTFLGFIFYTIAIRKWAKEYFTFFVIVVCCLNLLFNYTLVLLNDYYWARPYTFIVSLMTMLIMSLLTSRYKDFRAIFSALLPVSFAMAIRSLQDIFLKLTDNIYLPVLIGAATYICVGLFTVLWLKPRFTKLMHLIPELWAPIAIVPIIFTSVHFLLTTAPSTVFENPSIIPALFVLIGFQIFAYYFLCKFCIRLLSEISEKQDAYAQTSIMALNKAQENFILEVEKTIKIYRHDARHYTSLLTSYLKAGEIEKALKSLSYLSSEMEKKSEIRKYCSNLTINAIISRYATVAEKRGVDFQTHIRISDSLPFDEVAFGIALSNALENGFNACKFLSKKTTPYVKLKCVGTNEKFLLHVENPYAGEILFDENGAPISFEPDHGLGTESITIFAHKNDAMLNFTTEKHVFNLILAKNLV